MALRPLTPPTLAGAVVGALSHALWSREVPIFGRPATLAAPPEIYLPPLGPEPEPWTLREVLAVAWGALAAGAGLVEALRWLRRLHRLLLAFERLVGEAEHHPELRQFLTAAAAAAYRG